jgi:DNA-binding transcriptional ArsR family regulator
MSSIHFFLDNRNPIHIMRRVPQSKTTDSPYKVQVLDRALAALAILANSSSDCSLAELCPALKLHKSTVHRLMMVLEQHRLVVKNPETGRYRLAARGGSGFFRMAEPITKIVAIPLGPEC